VFEYYQASSYDARMSQRKNRAEPIGIAATCAGTRMAAWGRGPSNTRGFSERRRVGADRPRDGAWSYLVPRGGGAWSARSRVAVVRGRASCRAPESFGRFSWAACWSRRDVRHDAPVHTWGNGQPRSADLGSLPSMATPSSQSLTMAADPAAIMEVIADFQSYPEWAGHVKTVEITIPGEDPRRAKQVRFSMDAGLLKDTYELAYTWPEDGMSVSWTLVHGQLQKSQHGTYALQSTAEGTVVTYTLAVDLTVPMIGVLRRKAERVILDTALHELRKRVEAG
jgi:hypothetical protein